MKSNLISKSETNAVLKEVSNRWNMEFPKIKNLMVYHVTDDAEIIVGENLKILKKDEEYLPFLSETQLLEKFPYVMVDMGAIKFVCNGANVMRPGIKNYSEFEKGQIICVIEESQKKFLAVGNALVSSSEMSEMKKGEVVNTMHYISDKFWEEGKSI